MLFVLEEDDLVGVKAEVREEEDAEEAVWRLGAMVVRKRWAIGSSG